MTWWQVVLVYVGLRTADALIAEVVRLSVEWARDRLSQTRRPQYLAIYDDHGEVIKAIELPLEGDAVEVTEREQAKGPRPPGGDVPDFLCGNEQSEE